jgi:integrase
MGGSSCPRLLRRQGGGAGGGGCSTPERHADAPRRRRRFLDQHDLARSTRRVYAASLASLVASLGAATAVGNLSGLTLADWFRARYATAAPATWNRELATLRSRSPGGAPPWLACGRPDRRAGPPAGADRSHRALTRGELERRFARRDLIARERTLWRLLFETAARANELLALDVEDLDLANRRAGAQQGRRGGMGILADGISPAPPRLLASRTSGPVLLSGRKPTRAVAGLDLDRTSGRTRLSYRRAAELFHARTGWTLHQLRHSALTHTAEDGTNLPMLLARSRHASMRSLERYARPGWSATAVTDGQRYDRRLSDRRLGGRSGGRSRVRKVR